MTINNFIHCQSCKDSVPDVGKFCPHCGAYFALKNSDIHNAELTDQAEYYIYQAAEELIETGGKITQNQVGRIIVTGAAATALLGLTVAGVATGAIAGVGVGAFRHIRKKMND